MADKRSNDIIDISDSPDVAVWAKGISRKISIPADKVSEPTKSSSRSLYFRTNGKETFVDPANEKEIARAKAVPLTDEAEYGRPE